MPEQPSKGAPQPSTPMQPAQNASSSNIIQRALDDDNDGGGIKTYNRSDVGGEAEKNMPGNAAENQDSGGSEPSSQVDLADMAEKILPLVKRMLQVEAERSGRLFR